GRYFGAMLVESTGKHRKQTKAHTLASVATPNQRLKSLTRASMSGNVLPRLTEEQCETGLFRCETDCGPVAEKPVVDSLRETDAVPLMWLWPGRIPMEKVTVVVGPADSGKSVLAARVSRRVPRKFSKFAQLRWILEKLRMLEMRNFAQLRAQV